MIANKETDELIFDFLEGNLSPDEQEAFLILKEESEVLNRQVRLWQNTYLKEPLPSIQSLEKKLFMPSKHSVSFWSRIYLTLVMLLYVSLPGDRGPKLIPVDFEVVRFNNVSSLPADQAPITTIDCVDDNIPVATLKIKSKKSVENNLLVTESVMLTKLKLHNLFEAGQPTLRKISLGKGGPQKAISVASRKKWSRKEMRLIRQKRWQDSRARNANEFIKGNVPYVVPLNSNNF